MQKKAILLLIIAGFTLEVAAQNTWGSWAQSKLKGANQQLMDTMKRYQGSLAVGTATTAVILGMPKNIAAPLLGLYWLIFHAFKTKMDQGIEDFVYNVKYTDPNYSAGFQMGRYYVKINAKHGQTASIHLSKAKHQGDLTVACSGEYRNIPISAQDLSNALQALLGAILD